MEEVDKQGEHLERISELNNIFEELLGDARDFAKDLTSSISLYFLAGILSILFGLQTGWYNRVYIASGDYIPLLLAVAQTFAGVLLIVRGFGLRSKYERVFEIVKGLKRSGRS